ncbi:hypothetical protein YC2023_003451 [Brassica napus]
MRELRKGIRLKFRNRDVAVDGNVRESGDPEVGSSGWKSTARRVVSGAFPAALENPEDRVPLTPGRTHNRQVGSLAGAAHLRIHQVLDCSPTNRERELGLDRRETVREEPLFRTIGHRAWLKSQWREATVRWIMTERL